MREMRLSVNDSDLLVVFNYYANARGLMDYKVFVQGVRIPLSPHRLNLVINTFNELDKSGQGFIDASDLVHTYDSSRHPDVLLGVKTPEGVLSEWLNTFDVGGTMEGKVTKDEFVGYYSNLGVTISNDDYFELLIVNTWLKEDHEGFGSVYKEDQEVSIPRRVEFSEYDEPEYESSEMNRNVSTSPTKHHHRFQPQYYTKPVDKDPQRVSLQDPSSPMSASMSNWTDAFKGQKGLKSKEGVIFEKGGSNRHFIEKKTQIIF
jgi:Ca2+-binding EF-hand superfamily protein